MKKKRIEVRIFRLKFQLEQNPKSQHHFIFAIKEYRKNRFRQQALPDEI